ncbi:MAG: DUF1552 domain-containing protein [Bryobacterales bacterium]|nr:DUF1552 domain-containing protein [Bryobacterales bacterium]
MPGKSLPRRTVLRGLGTCLALPLLEAMVPAFGAPSKKKAPLRMAFVYVPNGIIMKDWTPQTEGDAAPLPEKLPRILEPLAAYREQMLLLSGLTLNGGRELGDGPGDHARAAASYLTGAHPKKTYGADMRNGISVDQLAAEKVGKQTRLASLELGCEEGILSGNCDNGYSCAYSNSLSWRTATSPLPPEVRPRAVFERLFGAEDADPDPVKRAQAQREQRSVLDFVLGQANSLRASLGATDQRKLDEYLFTVRDLEKRIETAERTPPSEVKPPFTKPGDSVPENFFEHAKLMYDMMAVAFQADLTRVITFMIGPEGSNRNYREIGITDAHHGLTHHLGDAAKIEKIAQINRMHVEQFTYFLNKLRAQQEDSGTILDNSMVVYGGGLSDGNRHDHHDLPVLITGRGAGSLKPGRHLRYAKETPLTNLYVAMLDRMGVDIEKLEDSTGRLGYLSM